MPSIRSYPKAILHVDGDAFFASCETALRPELRGKCVVTGKERGIASAASYEAKARGVKRGMTLSEVKRVCPEAIILPSDYETYSLFSRRMYDIVRRYTPEVEEYSIDECFADITGMRRALHSSYEGIAANVKADLERELGMTFSVGLGPNKVLAKVGSKWQKPSGLVYIPARDAPEFLAKLPTEAIWGIGRQTSLYLAKYGIRTAGEFAARSEAWVTAHLTKPHRELWRELQGESVFPLNLLAHEEYQSISKTKTFTPPSSDPVFIFAQLSKNAENACIKARRHHLAASEAYFFLKTQDFRYHGVGVRFAIPTASPVDVVSLIREHFPRVFRRETLYRATGVTLVKLGEAKIMQQDLFGATERAEEARETFRVIDEIDAKFGKHTVFLGSTHRAIVHAAHQGERGDVSRRSRELFKGENARQRLGIPMMGETN